MPDLSTITPVTREEEFLDRIARAAASPNLPEVDASDNGDVLTVVSGEWAAAAPPSGLPEVTSSNNGQVLTVVSGEWEAAAPAAGTVIVHCTGEATYELDDNTEYWDIPIDMTLAQIATALAAGPVYVAVPPLRRSSPYYQYGDGYAFLLPVFRANLVGSPVEISVIMPYDETVNYTVTVGGVAVKSIKIVEFNDTPCIEFVAEGIL